MAIVSHLIADSFGSHIGKYSERLKITRNGETLAQAPLLHLQSLHITSRGISISADALEACCERGIPVHFLDSQGSPYANIYAAALTGTVRTRREQLRAYDDERGALLGVAIARGKIENARITLKYFAKSRRDTEQGAALLEAENDLIEPLAALDRLDRLHIDDLRPHILAVEGRAARCYWDAVGHILPTEYGWTGRTTRGATDPVNSLLNYGYGILYSQIERALVLAGLDPFAGFVHADRPGKPSLVLDLIEEFRQTVVDRVVVGLVSRRFGVEQDEHGRLTEDVRRKYAEHILDHLESKVKVQGERCTLRHVIQTQARHLASALRGESAAYVPYRAEW
ncbi:MAG: CRISPR-associated endonuclease Cas1 [Anaerolineae bacterium]|nr:CRISPR-associated endonuclease Cas1 [Anaerolineae bacterium]NUQ04758.1 CRISPR-associated endonuclease Cas1 [Anaerolineae bacterium]